MNSPASRSPETPQSKQNTKDPSPEILYPRVGPLAQKLGSLEISGTFSAGRSMAETVPSTIDITINTGGVAVNAINRLRSNRLSRRVESNSATISDFERGENIGAVAKVAEINIQKRAPVKEYNPLKTWDTHVKRRPLRTIHHAPTVLSGREDQPRAINSLQEMRQQKMSRHHQLHSRLGDQIERFTGLYGDVLYDSSEVEALLRNGDFTRGEKKSIRQAGKIVRSYKNKSLKIEKKLEKVATGNVDQKRKRVEKDERKITKLETKATSRNNRRAERKNRRAERKKILIGANRSAQINRQLARSTDPSKRKIIYDQAYRSTT